MSDAAEIARPAFLDNSAVRRRDLAWDDWPAIVAFLSDECVCHLAVPTAGAPYVVGQSFRFAAGKFLLHCSRHGRLAGLMRARPVVSIVVDRLTALLKAPKGQNTSFEYYSVLAECTVEYAEEIPNVKRQQYQVLGKYRYEGGYEPIDDAAPAQIVTFDCKVKSMTAKKRILADGQYSPPGQPKAPYVRFAFPPGAQLSALPDEAFDSKRFPKNKG
jgi:nitroimidazol reductase NimA-like FMN-containing flavoprotein (pyridoxamine 5'-phosphate oxidase superfamily)